MKNYLLNSISLASALFLTIFIVTGINTPRLAVLAVATLLIPHWFIDDV